MHPNLFIIGAPKCGTTTIYQWLSELDDVPCVSPKEPHCYYNPYARRVSHESYLAPYKEKPVHRYAVNASVFYMYSSSAVERIVQSQPKAEFIVCVRDPVDAVPSLHWQKVFTGHEGLTELRRAWDVSDDRTAGKFSGIVNLPRTADPSHMAYKNVFKFGRLIANLDGLVDQQNLLMIDVNDIVLRPQRVRSDMNAFLGTEIDEAHGVPHANPAKSLRSPALNRAVYKLGDVKRRIGIRRPLGFSAIIRRINQTETKYDAISLSMAEQIRMEYRADWASLKRNLQSG